MKYLVLMEDDWYLRGIPLYDDVRSAGDVASRDAEEYSVPMKVYKLVEVGHYGRLTRPED